MRDVLEFGHYAPQSGRPRGEKQRLFFSIPGPANRGDISEDCLYLVENDPMSEVRKIMEKRGGAGEAGPRLPVSGNR